jgi:urease accessory protein
VTDPAALLLLLQHGDSFFPGGGFASSWGLETLHAEGHVGDAAALGRFIDTQLRHRWATCDRPALVAAHRAGSNLDRVAETDAEVDALSLARDLRLASRRAGRALLRVHSRLGSQNAAAYLDWIHAGRGFGHVPVIQGLVWKSAGLDEGDAVTLSAHLLCVALVSAAVRLGCITHIDAQETLRRARHTAAGLMRLPAPEHPSSFTPVADIAVMRHEAQPVRLFAS